MKNLLLLLIALLLVNISSLTQAPEKFKYQAIITDNKDHPVKNKAIGLEISILQSNLNGIIVYQETFTTRTSNAGLVNLEIGTGMITSGVFSDINWGVGSYYLGIAVDMNGSGNYISMGASQLLSVPYALFANKTMSVEGDNDTDPTNELQILTLEDDILKLSLTNDEVSLSSFASHWRLWGDDLLQFTGAVDIGDNYTSGPVLRVDGNITVGKSGENPGTYGIGGPSPESGLSITGGTLGGGQIYLFGPNHISHPGEVHLRAGGYESILINPDGNVGIGTSTPNYKLDVSGDINFTGTLHQNGNPFNNNDADTDPTNELELPEEDGTVGQVLTTNGEGIVSWQSASGGVMALSSVLTEGNDGGANQIKNIADPTEDQDAATKAYVDLLQAQIASLGARLTVLEANIEPATIGEFRGGGVVFWVDPTDNTHGLICAIEDQGAIRWHNGSFIATGATGTAIGTGVVNSDLIIEIQGPIETSYAAGLARAYRGGGYTGWFLPSNDELNEMNLHIDTINAVAMANGGTAFILDEAYWSSTEFSSERAWNHLFKIGQGVYYKVTPARIRAVRAF